MKRFKLSTEVLFSEDAIDALLEESYTVCCSNRQ